MSNTSQDQNSSVDTQKNNSKKPSRRMNNSSKVSKDSKSIKPRYPVSRYNYKDDGLKISPLLLIGLFIAALGIGFLFGPSNDPLSAPAYQTWSVIIIGIIIAIPGAIQMVWDYYKQKKQK